MSLRFHVRLEVWKGANFRISPRRKYTWTCVRQEKSEVEEPTVESRGIIIWMKHSRFWGRLLDLGSILVISRAWPAFFRNRNPHHILEEKKRRNKDWILGIRDSNVTNVFLSNPALFLDEICIHFLPLFRMDVETQFWFSATMMFIWDPSGSRAFSGVIHIPSRKITWIWELTYTISKAQLLTGWINFDYFILFYSNALHYKLVQF